ncbi:MAG: hypothetical protein QG584_2640, partial [Pseudomonadota bacterium]|nr:hypothetical protein [Pseudomonadota bacterium]
MPDTATEALEKFRQDANDAYDKASSSEQAKMRLLMAIHVIEESGSSHEEKFDCLNMAIKAYTCDTVIGVCDKLKDG